MSSEEMINKNKDYKYGFYTDIETEEFPKGLNEDIINPLKEENEPEWMLEYRLENDDPSELGSSRYSRN